MLKRELRKSFLARRRLLSTSEARCLSEQIAGRFFAGFDLNAARVIHFFLSMETNEEIDTRQIIDRILTSYPMIEVAVPRVCGDELETLQFNSEAKLKLSNWNIPEPVGNRFIDPESIDLVIVPLLAFDLRGHRVGYGKGFYDRFLKTCRDDCVKAGVSFFPPVEDIDDATENDVRLDFCLTPFALFKF